MTDEINVLSRSQIINVEPSSGSVAVINAGPPGPSWSSWKEWTPRISAGVGDYEEPDWTDVVRGGRYKRNGHLIVAQAEISGIVDGTLSGELMISVPVSHDEGPFTISDTYPVYRPINGSFIWGDTSYEVGGVSVPMSNSDSNDWFYAGVPPVRANDVWDWTLLRWGGGSDHFYYPFPSVAMDSSYGYFSWTLSYMAL
jgi:hypothetical protein